MTHNSKGTKGTMKGKPTAASLGQSLLGRQHQECFCEFLQIWLMRLLMSDKDRHGPRQLICDFALNSASWAMTPSPLELAHLSTYDPSFKLTVA